MATIRGQSGRKTARSEPTPAPERRYFGTHFRLAREALGYSQRDVARMLRVNQPFVSNVETGGANLTIERLSLLARFVGQPLHEMLRPVSPRMEGEREDG